MSVELIERVALALQYGRPTLNDRRRVAAAVPLAEDFADLPATVRQLVEALEEKARQRFGPLP